ncbi:MAG: UDP-N-acetylmuramoylalanine--D-glutamate ligase [Oceanicoccus sp.]|jgi:UDP-N-acetylmuramoylalanine--D-glutamate ligase
MDPKTFIFDSYELDADSREIRLRYGLDDDVQFEEVISLPEEEWKTLDSNLLDRALFNLHLIGGISYYKAHCPKEIVVKSGALSENEAYFWNKLYTQGLGEFFYENELDFRNLVNFPVTPGFQSQAFEVELKKRSLVPLGGGKDSIVACELLKKASLDFEVFNMGGHQVTKDVAAVMGKELIIVKRTLSEKLFELNAAGAMNGHIPITAYVSFLSVLMALLYDFDTVVFANEASSNYGNVKLHDMVVNHQYSKSLEFEQDLSGYLFQFLTPSLKVFSLLRPWFELRIAKEYVALTEYHHVATSCNRNFKIKGEGMETRWCGECPKCAFVFAILSPFMNRERLVEIFGKDLLKDKKLKTLYSELIGEANFKPFECVGTPDEVKTALNWASESEFKVDREDLMVFHKEHLLPARFLDCFTHKFLVLGFGKEGKSTFEYLKKTYPKAEIGVADQNQIELADGITGHIGEDYLDALPHYDMIIKSPGIPWNDELIKHKDRITSATQIFFDQLDPSNTVIAVTGSKGKSTTASLMAAVLEAMKKPVVLVGNIGEPMLNHAEKKDTFFVAELSSYQLEHTWIKPKIAIFTCLFPDHLDYHGSFENYSTAKARVTEKQGPDDVLIYHKKYSAIDQLSTQALRLGINKYKTTEALLPGAHNQDNIALVRTAAHVLELDKETVDKTIASFKVLPHRLEVVREYQGVTYVDDANATTPQGTLAALRTYKGQIGTIFLGGLDRGYDFKELGQELADQKVANVILFPDSGPAIQKAWPTDYTPQIFETKSMEDAVNWASENTEEGRLCLLSMASPSYSIFKNYKDKGAQFQRYVNALK